MIDHGDEEKINEKLGIANPEKRSVDINNVEKVAESIRASIVENSGLNYTEQNQVFVILKTVIQESRSKQIKHLEGIIKDLREANIDLDKKIRQ